MHKSRTLILLVLGLSAAAASAGPPPQTSWGKPGVSMFQYRLDSTGCIVQAINHDIAATPQAQQLVKASRALDAAHNSAWLNNPSFDGGTYWGNPGLDIRRTMDTLRVDDQFTALERLQHEVLTDCLESRGYRQFRLTPDQQARLKKLRHGSDGRRAFLHSLGSDPQVLASQGV